MRIFLLFLVLAGGGLAYVHSQQPKMWNQFLALLQVFPAKGRRGLETDVHLPRHDQFHQLACPLGRAAGTGRRAAVEESFRPPATLPRPAPLGLAIDRRQACLPGRHRQPGRGRPGHYSRRRRRRRGRHRHAAPGNPAAAQLRSGTGGGRGRRAQGQAVG